MLNDTTTLASPAPLRLGPSNTRKRFALIAGVLAAVVGTFLYLGGWFSPNALTPSAFVAAFEAVDGTHPGFRRNHAKGLGVVGYFQSNGNGARLSRATVFQPGRADVLGRFSLSGGDPDAADAPGRVRGLGLQFSLPNGELWRTAMINLPVFPFRTPEAFYENLILSKPDPNTGKPDPAKHRAFLDHHPETDRALQVITRQTPSSGFGNSTFRSLNAFLFTNASGETVPVRWVLEPEQTVTTPVPPGKNSLFEALIADIRRQPLRWRLMIIVGKPGDPTNDATRAWPEEREKVTVGTLVLERAESDDTSAATDLNFDPLVLPAGIAPSDDPLLSARSAVYSRSFTRRAGETRQPSAITPADVQKGR
jgi:catalase